LALAYGSRLNFGEIIMSIRAPWLAAGILLIDCASASAQVKDAVELLPVHTLACIELRQPARLSREMAALVKGSVVDDLPRRLGKLRGSYTADRSYQKRVQLEILSVFLCPEGINESGRIGGGVIALTGIAKDNTPEVVGVLQTGSSNLPGMMMRVFLTEELLKLVGEVEGVPLYRETNLEYRSVAPGQPPKMEERQVGPVVGQMPGMILFGSSVDSLKGVIRRAKGKSAGASLTSLRAFKESAALRERPGLFAYVDVAALEAKIDEQTTRAEECPGSSWWPALKAILGNQAVRSAAFSLTLRNGTLEGQTRFHLDSKNDSPLLGLLPDGAAQRDLLHFAPNDALLALTGGLGDHEKRWKTFVGVLDALYKLNGGIGDNRPSRAIEEMEKKLDFHINKDVFAELTGAGIVVHKDWRHKSGQVTLRLRAADEKAAAKIEKDGLPRLFSLGDSEARVAIEQEVQGRRIKTMRDWSGVRLFLPPVHYGRQGAVLVIGFDQECVAESLVNGGKKQGFLADTKVAAAVKEIDEKAVAVGVLSSARAALDLFAVMSRPPLRIKLPGSPAPGGAVPPPPPLAEQLPEKSNEPSKPMQALFSASEPLVFSLTRQPECLDLEIRPLRLRRMTPRLLDAWVETLLKPIAVNAPSAE
ncbi:MAG: hypothetical protein ACYC3I_27990, partial [Gemmataceae bacterium]